MDDSPDALSDEAIIAGLRGNGAARLSALNAAYSKYGRAVLGFSRQLLGEHALSDAHNTIEVLDETFKALWTKPPDGTRSTLFTWLCGVARHKALSLKAKVKRRKAVECANLQDTVSDDGTTLEESGELSLIAAGLESPWEGLVQAEYLEMVAECVEDLPPVQKVVGSIILEAAKNTGEWPSNEDLFSEVKRRTEDKNLTLEAVKSAKKQVRAKLYSKLKSHEHVETKSWVP